MSYLVLARKWRPQTFEAITGQSHVTRTLQNAIEQDRVHHAFLFCGARGVGKTSAARVFARALNCLNQEAPTAHPCGECRACTEIAAGTAIDVMEIDGASNRGINEIRAVRDGVAYAPTRDRHKIYIIDEVHMLTTEAFNALLKTLEEPPKHVKFIFATTEPHKIPVTILSRCQRFDFKRIPMAIMVERLGEILDAEGISIDAAGLRLVARESEGSMRDALSLLDRIISFAGTEASLQQVQDILGVADRGWLRELIESALQRDAPRGLAMVAQVFEYGTDLRQFAGDLVHYLRDIVVLRVAGVGAGLTDLADEETAVLVSLGRDHAPEDLERLFNIATDCAERLAQAGFPRMELEMAVIRMCQLRPLQPIDNILGRVNALQRYLESGAPLPEPSTSAPAPVSRNRGEPDPQPAPLAVVPRPAAPSPAPAAPVAAAREPEPVASEPEAPANEPEPVASEPEAPANEPEPVASEPEAPANEPEPEASEPEAPANEPEPVASEPEAPASEPEPVVSEPEPVASEPEAPASEPEAPASEPEPVVSEPEVAASEPEVAASEPEVAASEPEAPAAAPEAAAAEPPVPEDVVEEGAEQGAEEGAEEGAPQQVALLYDGPPISLDGDKWEAFVADVRGTNPVLAARLDHAEALGVEGPDVRLAVRRLSTMQRELTERSEEVDRWLATHFAPGLRSVIVPTDADAITDSPFERRRQRDEAVLAKRESTIRNHPAVQRLIDRFAGTLEAVNVLGLEEQPQ